MCVARRLSAARGRKVIGVPVRQRSTGRGGRTERRRARRRAHEDLRGRLGRGTPAKQGAPARARARARTRRHRAPSPPPSLPHLHTVVCFSLAERGRSANLPRTQKNAVHEHSPRTRPTNDPRIDDVSRSYSQREGGKAIAVANTSAPRHLSVRTRARDPVVPVRRRPRARLAGRARTGPGFFKTKTVAPVHA